MKFWVKEGHQVVFPTPVLSGPRQHSPDVRLRRGLRGRGEGAAGVGRQHRGAQRERPHAADGGGQRRARGGGQGAAGERGGHQHALQRVQGERPDAGLLQRYCTEWAQGSGTARSPSALLPMARAIQRCEQTLCCSSGCDTTQHACAMCKIICVQSLSIKI